MANNTLSMIRLQFTTPFHIGNERSDYGTGSALIHNDAIIAAIFYAWAQLGQSEWIPKKEEETCGFSVSSLFPYTTNEAKKIYFFPKPMVSLKNEEILETKLRKKLKKVKYVDAEIFVKMISGEVIPAEEKQVNSVFRSLTPIAESIVKSQVVPRVRVSRTGQDDTTIFYMERYYFAEGSGLYCLLQYDSEEIEKRVNAAFRYLGEEGIGTDRNIGNGKFLPSFGESLSLNIDIKKGLGINLGLYCPKDKDELNGMINHEDAGYDIIKRGGWLSEPYNTWRKKNVYMFSEGSIFCLPQKSIAGHVPVLGKLVNLQPTEKPAILPHPVWRSGKSLFIPF
jgi:CRISPR type III-A-associated RAMP protein Csm4